tara:strand:- start:34 stop:339 length:306 start_codon:yes stop_codon:yes gene_type:complete
MRAHLGRAYFAQHEAHADGLRRGKVCEALHSQQPAGPHVACRVLSLKADLLPSGSSPDVGLFRAHGGPDALEQLLVCAVLWVKLFHLYSVETPELVRESNV